MELGMQVPMPVSVSPASRRAHGMPLPDLKAPAIRHGIVLGRVLYGNRPFPRQQEPNRRDGRPDVNQHRRHPMNLSRRHPLDVATVGRSSTSYTIRRYRVGKSCTRMTRFLGRTHIIVVGLLILGGGPRAVRSSTRSSKTQALVVC